MDISDEKKQLFEVYLDRCTEIAKPEILKDADLLQDDGNEIHQVLLAEAECRVLI